MKFVDTGSTPDTSDDKTCFTFSVFNDQIGLFTSNTHTSSNFQGARIGDLTSIFEVDLVVDWTASPPSVDLWYQPALGSGPQNRQLALQGVPFIDKCTRVSRVIYWHEDSGFTSTVYPITFCNPSQDSKFKEVPKMTAVASVNSVFKQSISGKTDFAFSSTFSNATFTQTTNWKLRGGDTSKLDFLDPKKGVDVINEWKSSVYDNPAPISFSLKPISTLFPAPSQESEVDFRVEVDQAISEWILVKEEIPTPGLGPTSCDSEGRCEITSYVVEDFIQNN